MIFQYDLQIHSVCSIESLKLHRYDHQLSTHQTPSITHQNYPKDLLDCDATPRPPRHQLFQRISTDGSRKSKHLQWWGEFGVHHKVPFMSPASVFVKSSSREWMLSFTGIQNKGSIPQKQGCKMVGSSFIAQPFTVPSSNDNRDGVGIPWTTG